MTNQSPIDALNEAILHEPDPPRFVSADQVTVLKAKNAALKAALEHSRAQTREYFRCYKLWRGSFFVASAWAVSLAVALIWRMA